MYPEFHNLLMAEFFCGILLGMAYGYNKRIFRFIYFSVAVLGLGISVFVKIDLSQFIQNSSGDFELRILAFQLCAVMFGQLAGERAMGEQKNSQKISESTPQKD